jgi:hypothetical protein
MQNLIASLAFHNAVPESALQKKPYDTPNLKNHKYLQTI